MSSKVRRPGERLWIVIPASTMSGDAAGKTPAYLSPIKGRPMIAYVLDACTALEPAGIAVISGAGDVMGRELSRIGHGDAAVVEQKGAGLVSKIREMFSGREGDILFVSATLPFMSAEVLTELIGRYRDKKTPYQAAKVGTTGKPKGRTALFISDVSLLGDITETGESPDESCEERLFSLLEREATRKGGAEDFVPTQVYALTDVGSPREFSEALAMIRATIVERLMDAGVTVIDPSRTYVDPQVRVGEGTTLYPDTYLEGETEIGKNCLIEPNVKIVGSKLADEVVVKMCSVITDSVIGRRVQIGPFAHLRPKTRLKQDVKIGNFVEVKKSVIDAGSKANHLTYIGDAKIGKQVNVGAGTITCNYDGASKHVTEIGDGVFIGSDTQFIAPVSVGEYSLIGAGSTITKDVPPNTLAVSRTKQVNLPDRGVKSRKK